MIPLASELAPTQGITSWNNSNKKGRIHIVGKMTQVSNPGPLWPSCYSIYDRFIQRQPCPQKLLTGFLPNLTGMFLK